MNSFFQLPDNTSERWMTAMISNCQNEFVTDLYSWLNPFINSFHSDGLNGLGLDVDWTAEICHKYPYALYSPISFEWSYLGESGGRAVCPWPFETSIYRVAVAGTNHRLNISKVYSRWIAGLFIVWLTSNFSNTFRTICLRSLLFCHLFSSHQVPLYSSTRWPFYLE
jgi:hypothetical protein